MIDAVTRHEVSILDNEAVHLWPLAFGLLLAFACVGLIGDIDKVAVTYLDDVA